jgi:hypothetical protein
MSPPTNTCISAIYSCQIIWQILQKFKKVRNTVNANTDLVRAMILNKGNAKRDVSPHLKIRPWPWPWKSIGFQILLRSKYVPSLVKIHWRMLILECSQGCYTVNIWPSDIDLWPWKSIGFRTLLRTKYVPSLVKTIEGCWF